MVRSDKKKIKKIPHALIFLWGNLSTVKIDNVAHGLKYIFLQMSVKLKSAYRDFHILSLTGTMKRSGCLFRGFCIIPGLSNEVHIA